MTRPRLDRLRRLLRPRHIAFVGGRSMEGAIAMCRATGFEGPIWPVHPGHATLGGLPVHRSLDALPEPPDATFLYVGRDSVVDVVAGLERIGAGGAICHAAGFGEVGEDGRRLQARLVEAAGDLALVGPNSNGLMNYADGVALWPIEDHRPAPCTSGVAVISQSGGVAIEYTINKRSIPVTHVVSTGNQLLLDAADFIEVLSDDPRVRAIGLFTEGIADGPRFAAAAAVALERGVPIVALKAGRTEIGARMALTHTASLAGGDTFYQALFDRLGIARVRTLSAFHETLKMASTAALPTGRRTAVLTTSGAVRTMTADLAAEAELELPQPSEDVARALQAQMPGFAQVSNPLDYNPAYAGSEGLTLENRAALEHCYETMLREPVDVALLVADLGGESKAGELARRSVIEAWLAVVARLQIPAAMASVLPEGFREPYRRRCLEGGVAPLQGLDDAMAAIAAVTWMGERRGHIARAGGPAAVRLPGLTAAPADGPAMDEQHSREALAAAGLPVNPSAVVPLDAVGGLADSLGYPVALKVASPAIVHKARVGGVALGLRDRAAVELAAADMDRALRSRGLGFDGFLVERMVEDAEAELLIGVVRDARFGHALVIGAGGGRVEALRDTETLLLPAVAGDIAAAVDRLLARLGLPDAARAPVTAAAEAVARFAAERRDELVELDVNPLIVRRGGAAVVAVDAVVRLAQPARAHAPDAHDEDKDR